MNNKARKLCSRYSEAMTKIETLKKEEAFYRAELEGQHTEFENYVLRSRLSEAEAKMKTCMSDIGLYKAFTSNLDRKQWVVLEQVYGQHLPWSEIVNEQNQSLSHTTVGRILRGAYAAVEKEIEKMEAEYVAYRESQSPDSSDK